MGCEFCDRKTWLWGLSVLLSTTETKVKEMCEIEYVREWKGIMSFVREGIVLMEALYNDGKSFAHSVSKIQKMLVCYPLPEQKINLQLFTYSFIKINLVCMEICII